MNGIFHQARKKIQKFMQNNKTLQIAIAILRKNNKVGQIKLPDIKLYYKFIVMTTAWYCYKNRHIDQLNRDLRNKPMLLHSIFNKGSKNIQWDKDSLFNKWGRENWTDMCQKK